MTNFQLKRVHSTGQNSTDLTIRMCLLEKMRFTIMVVRRYGDEKN